MAVLCNSIDTKKRRGEKRGVADMWAIATLSSMSAPTVAKPLFKTA
jgi:hypothetical protein